MCPLNLPAAVPTLHDRQALLEQLAGKPATTAAGAARAPSVMHGSDVEDCAEHLAERCCTVLSRMPTIANAAPDLGAAIAAGADAAPNAGGACAAGSQQAGGGSGDANDASGHARSCGAVGGGIAGRAAEGKPRSAAVEATPSKKEMAKVRVRGEGALRKAEVSLRKLSE
eukprot:16391-Chlamydomonas_euryale.AAC.1